VHVFCENLKENKYKFFISQTVYHGGPTIDNNLCFTFTSVNIIRIISDTIALLNRTIKCNQKKVNKELRSYFRHNKTGTNSVHFVFYQKRQFESFVTFLAFFRPHRHLIILHSLLLNIPCYELWNKHLRKSKVSLKLAVNFTKHKKQCIQKRVTLC